MVLRDRKSVPEVSETFQDVSGVCKRVAGAYVS